MIYRIDNVPLSNFGAIPSPNSGFFALSGMLDLPRRIGATEYDWGTEIEPFVDEEDIELDGRTLILNVAIKKSQLQVFKNTCIVCTELSIDNDTFQVIQKDEIRVDKIGGYYYASVPFWQNIVELKPVNITASGAGEYRIDGYNLPKDFGVYIAESNNLQNLAKRIDVQATEFYTRTQFRGLRTIDLSCAIHAANFAELYDKMNQFQSILIFPGLRTLSIRNNAYSVYFKDGMKVDIINENIAKFNLRATVV